MALRQTKVLFFLTKFYTMIKATIAYSEFQKQTSKTPLIEVSEKREWRLAKRLARGGSASIYLRSRRRRRRWRRIYRIIDCKLVSVSPLPYHLNSPSRANAPFTFFQSVRHTIAGAASFPSLFARKFARSARRQRSQFVSAAPFRPAVLLTKSRPREIHPRALPTAQ